MPAFKLFMPAALALIGTANTVVPAPAITTPDTGDTLSVLRESSGPPSFFGGEETYLDQLVSGARPAADSASSRQEVAISTESAHTHVDDTATRFDAEVRADRASARTESATDALGAASARTEINAEAARINAERDASDEAETQRLRYHAIEAVTADRPRVTTTTAPATTNTTWRATTTTTTTSTTSTTSTAPPTTQPPATRTPATQAPAPAAPAGASGTLACIRRIESGGNYGAVNSTGRFRGAYQFDRTTWNSVAARHNPAYVGVDPAAAPAAVQDQLAAALISERGLSPWPTPNRRCR